MGFSVLLIAWLMSTDGWWRGRASLFRTELIKVGGGNGNSAFQNRWQSDYMGPRRLRSIVIVPIIPIY